MQTCYHVWILPLHNIHYSVTDHLMQCERNLVKKIKIYKDIII